MKRLLLRGRGGLTFWLGVIVTAGFFWVNIAGFVDTETGSALGCGHDWPLCNGTVIPSVWGLHTIIEFLHRASVGIVVSLLVVFASLALIKYRQWREIKVLVSCSFVLTVIQSILGALGVLLPHDPPAVLAVHLGVSLLALNAVFLITVVVGQIRRQQQGKVPELRTPVPNKKFPRWVLFTTIYTFILMYVGAYVAKTGDGGIFQGWPLPTESASQFGQAWSLDILHRGLALGLLLIAIRITIFAYHMKATHRNLYIATLILVVLVCLQAVSGMALIFTHLSLSSFLSHVTIVSCLFAALCYLCLQVTPIPSRAPRLRMISATPRRNKLGVR